MEALALREVGVDTNGAGVVVVAVGRSLTSGLHDGEHRGLGDPVALLHLGANGLGGLDRGNQHLDQLGVDVGGQECRDTGVADGHKAGLGIQGQIDVMGVCGVQGHGLGAHEVNAGPASKLTKVDIHTAAPYREMTASSLSAAAWVITKSVSMKPEMVAPAAPACTVPSDSLANAFWPLAAAPTVAVAQ